MTIIIVAFVEDGYAATPSEEGSLERCRSAIKPFGVWLKVVFIFLALDLAKGWIARCRGDERCRLEGWPLRLEKLWACLSKLLIWVSVCMSGGAALYPFERSCEILDEPPMVYHLVLAWTVTSQVLGCILLFGWVCAILASPVLLLRHAGLTKRVAVLEAELTERVAVLEASMVSGGRVTMAAGKRREEALLLVQKTCEKAGVQTAASQRQRP
jgi:hypothetical protein